MNCFKRGSPSSALAAIPLVKIRSNPSFIISSNALSPSYTTSNAGNNKSMERKFNWQNYFMVFIQMFKLSTFSMHLEVHSYKTNDIYLLKVNNGNTRTMWENCSKLSIKTPEQSHWCRSGVFIVNFDRFHTIFWCFHCWLWINKCRLKTIANIISGSVKE